MPLSITSFHCALRPLPASKTLHARHVLDSSAPKPLIPMQIQLLIPGLLWPTATLLGPASGLALDGLATLLGRGTRAVREFEPYDRQGWKTPTCRWPPCAAWAKPTPQRSSLAATGCVPTRSI